MALDRDRLVKPVKKLDKLVHKMDREPTPKKVHDLRTHSRRFEALFEALDLDAQGIHKSTVKNLGRFHKRAGKVRDMDVLTAFAASVEPQKGEEDCAVRLLEFLGARRRKYARKLSAEVHRHGPGLRGDLKRTKGIVGKLGPDTNGAVPHAAAAAVKLAVELGEPPRLTRGNLHPYRIKIKELINILRMAAGSAEEKFVGDLDEVKNAIGAWHDWEELVLIAQKSLDHGSRCRLLTEIRRAAKSKYEHARTLAEALREKYLRDSVPQKKGAAAARVPGNAVWQAISTLAG